MRNLLPKAFASKEKELPLKYCRFQIFFMKTIQSKITYVEKASRVEMLYRIVWAIIAGIVLAIFAIVAGLADIIQFFYILIYGKRQKGIFDFVKAVEIQRFRLTVYLTFVTDERPPIVPEMNV